MSQVLQPYDQFLASADLSIDQTLSDVFFSLEKLNEIFSSVSSRVSKRIDDETARIKLINDRIGICQGKAQAVCGFTSKATTVHSTAKFPGPKQLPPSITLFSTLNKLGSAVPEPEDDVVYIPAEPKKSAAMNAELTEELYTIFGVLNLVGSEPDRVEFLMEEKGLGSLPSFIPSVGSLLLFNSNINP